MILPEEFRKVVALRRELHAHPELSGLEEQTAARLKSFLETYRPDQLHTGVGGHGLLAVFDSGRRGQTVAIRCELDALPIEEPNDIPHRSTRKGVSHKCGHDGHMAAVAALAALVRRLGLPCGRVVLLFQAAEESGEGARAMLRDPRFTDLNTDCIFAFHNLPKHPASEVVVRAGTFACASVGLVARFEGAGTHSSYPEHGRSPAPAVAGLIAALGKIAAETNDPDSLSLVTVTQAQVGDMGQKIDFGVAPCGWMRHRGAAGRAPVSTGGIESGRASNGLGNRASGRSRS